MVVMVGGQLIVERIYSYAIPISVFITVLGGITALNVMLDDLENALL